MKSTTYFGLQSQTTRLVNQITRIEIYAEIKYGILTLFVLLFIVTTSLCQDWVICAPAAFLRSGSHFSGTLSGIEP